MSRTPLADLHVPGAPLVLTNAWDAVTAAIAEQEGARAVATTSGGVAWSLGYADGNAVPIDEIVAATRRIARVLTVPLTVDAEAGFAEDAADAAANVRRLHEAGAAGVNLEDSWSGGLRDAGDQADRLRAVLDAAPDLFVNARTDAFLLGSPTALADAIERGVSYAAAGAGALFVPGLTDLDALRELVDAQPLPVAVMASVGGPSVADFAGVGVARVSVGTDLAEAALRTFRESARTVLAGSALPLASSSYGELNGLLTRG
ncbi:isocitrate lyase/phosphoenolpyruvate mutase family protein [Microbacterium sp. ZW T5_56]|uniref:isocitrate lyase/PEP mutase family protein n=1 Tax=Microbacterium sp. ZW T5_56 TaxID=3378081 RepID=UPI00385269AF